MAQLSDDCFAFNGPLMPVADAERLIAERVTPVDGTESVTLRGAAGRVLARDVIAPMNLPPFDNSAVDGYAVRAGDLDAAHDSRLTIVDRVAAGHAAGHGVKAGEAIRIFTGAPMPDGADTVFMQEDCRLDDGAVIVPPGLKRGANRRLAGEDIAAGAGALPAGRRLSAPDVALAAALGLPALTVRRRAPRSRRPPNYRTAANSPAQRHRRRARGRPPRAARRSRSRPPAQHARRSGARHPQPASADR